MTEKLKGKTATKNQFTRFEVLVIPGFNSLKIQGSSKETFNSFLTDFSFKTEGD